MTRKAKESEEFEMFMVEDDTINEELLVENEKVLYDFEKEINEYFITKEQLREYMYAREWRTAEDFDLKEFLRFYQGMVKNAASK